MVLRSLMYNGLIFVLRHTNQSALFARCWHERLASETLYSLFDC